MKYPNRICDISVVPVTSNSSFFCIFQRFYEISGSDPQLVSDVISPMKSVTMSFKLDLQGLRMAAANCIKLSYFTSFCIKPKCKCCSCTIQCTEVNQSQPIYISRLACLLLTTKHPTLTNISKKGIKINAWDAETTEQRHRLALRSAAVF